MLALVGQVAPLPGQEASAEPEFAIVAPAFLALRVGDVEAAAAWYARALALDPVKQLDAEDGRFRIRILARGNLTVELIEMRGTEAPPQPHLGIFKVGFYVDDIDAAHRWFREAGAELDDAIFTDDALAVRSFVLRDPDGNRLQVFEQCDGEC